MCFVRFNWGKIKLISWNQFNKKIGRADLLLRIFINYFLYFKIVADFWYWKMTFIWFTMKILFVSLFERFEIEFLSLRIKLLFYSLKGREKFPTYFSLLNILLFEYLWSKILKALDINYECEKKDWNLDLDLKSFFGGKFNTSTWSWKEEEKKGVHFC